MKRNWEDLVTTSEYLALQEVKKALDEAEFDEVERGLEELLESMGKKEKRALQSQLIRLMAHIIKWKIQPQRCSRSWSATILDARNQIEYLQEDNPALSRQQIESMWDKALQKAQKQAEVETGKKADNIKTLSWKEVFDKEYILPAEN